MSLRLARASVFRRLVRLPRRIPAPLAGVLAIALIQALAWAVVLPPFEGPDEVAHFAYTQRLAETGRVPWSKMEDIPREIPAYSHEVLVAEKWSSVGPLALNPSMRPYGTALDEQRWERVARHLGDADRSDGGFTSSMVNPPLYYGYAALAYLPLEHASVFTRAFAMRLATIPLFLVAVLGAWLLAGEVLGRRRWLQTVAASVVALDPLLAQLGGIVNPDVAIAAEMAIALWLAAVIVNRGATARRILASAALAVAAALTHGRALPVAVPLVLALGVAAWPRVVAAGARARLAAVAGTLLGVAGFIYASLWYALRGDVSADSVLQFGSYLWQFYLPRLGFMTPTVRADWDARDVFVDRVWSGFAQLDVNLAPGLLDAIAAATLVAALAVVLVAVVRGRAWWPRRTLAGVLLLAALALLWSLHVAAWRDLPRYGDPIITGRYLTPLLPLAGLALAGAASSLPRRVGPPAAMLVLGIEWALALALLGTAVVRFYG